jgi:kinetochore protein NDC80
MLDDIVRFKLHIQRSLEEYEQFVADEFDKTVNTQDKGVGNDSEEREGEGESMDMDMDME